MNKIIHYKTKLPLLTFLLTFIFLVSGAIASPTQTLMEQVKEKKVTIKMSNRPVRDILMEIKNQTAINFVLGSEVGKAIGNRTLDLKDATVDQALKTMLKDSGYEYEIANNYITIVPKKAEKEQVQSQETKRLLMGKVIHKSTKEPVIGATVVVENTTTGSVTDNKGSFVMSNVHVGAVMEIACMGMKTIYRTVTNKDAANITIEMEEDVIAVKDVVVTGYQTIDMRQDAGSATKRSMDDIRVTGAPNLDQMLQGTVAGMSVSLTSGEPSATAKIRIRGNATLSGSQAPVWVVDGVILEQSVPYNPSDINSEDAAYLIGNAIAGVNPQDIESITILKDAAATAIYGVKAANGVIVVSTKKGSVGRPVIMYAGSISMTQRPSYNNFDRMNSAQRVQLSKDIVDNNLTYPRIPIGDSYEGALHQLYKKELTQEQFDSKVITMQNRNTDWFKELFRTDISQSHSLNVSGGTQDVRYYFSAGYNSNLGAAKGSDNERLTSLGKIDVTLNKFIDFTMKVDFNLTENNGYSGVNPFSYAFQRSRTLPAYNEDGSLHYYNQGVDYKYNVINELNTTGQSSKTDAFGGLLNLNIKLVKGLKYSGTFSYNVSGNTNKDWATDHSYKVAQTRGYDFNKFPDTHENFIKSKLPYGGILYNNKTRSRSYIIRNQLEYTESFKDIHRVNAMLGAEARSLKYDGVSVTGYGWMPEFGEIFSPVYTDRFVNDVFKVGMLNPNNTNKITQVGSFFGTAAYSYDYRYVINANFRSDGSNKFGSNPKYRWLPTWSVSGKWNIAEENFMKSQDILSQLSVRGSYGIQGNIHDSSAPELIIQSGATDKVSNQNTFKIYRLPNPDLRWEKTTSWNLGLDFGLLEGRITGGLEVYGKFTTDLIVDKSVATSNGRNIIYINAGEMTNRGIEANVSADLINSKKFDWRFSFNLGRNINKVTLANGDIFGDAQRIDKMLQGNLAVEGAPAGSLYSYRYSGLSSTNGYPLFLAKDGRLVHEGEPQLMDLINSGTIFPAISGGFSTQFKFFKQLVATFDFSYNIGGVKRLPTVYEDEYRVFDPLSNVSTQVIDRWRKPGDEKHTSIPALIDRDITSDFVRDGLTATRPGVSGRNMTNIYQYSDTRVAKCNFLRLKMVALNYTLPSSALSKLKISSLTIRLQATNLAVWTSKEWNGLDPETPYATIPLLPTYSLGVNISF